MKNRKYSPKTAEEAADLAVSLLRDDIAQGHLEKENIGRRLLGMWVRNNFGLWGGNEILRSHLIKRYGAVHPDDMSTPILDMIFKKLEEDN